MSPSPSDFVVGREDNITAIKQNDSLTITEAIADEIIARKIVDELVIIDTEDVISGSNTSPDEIVVVRQVDEIVITRTEAIDLVVID